MKIIKNKLLKVLKDEEGMGVIEVVLIILVLVGLAFVFKGQISTISNGIYDSIKLQINNF